MAIHDSVLQKLYDLLLEVETAMKNHYDCLLTAVDTQRPVVERMQILAQRHTILVKGVPSRRLYPRESCHRFEDDVRADFHAKRCLLEESNTRLNSSLTDIREKYCGLNEHMKNMDEIMRTLDKGDSALTPAVYFVEWFGLLSPDNVTSLNTYKTLLDLNKEFKDHVAKSLAYCSCLHNKAKT